MGEVLEGDCLEVMAGMEENNVDSIVCDPPYELTSIVKRFGKEGSAPAKHGTDGRYARLSKGFMGKEWDGTGIAMRPEVWQKCLRVAKPGAYLLAFGGTRTFHHLACAIEDAGWTLRDTLSWCYGSGFPKSKNIALSIDKGEGHPNRGRAIPTASHLQNASDKHLESNPVPDYEAKSEAAKQWDGFGTALKPAWEPVLLFQKPLEGTYAENVLKWGCGALNIDSCRIGKERISAAETGREIVDAFTGEAVVKFKNKQGRWPANFLLSHTIFCEKVGEKRVRSGNATKRGGNFIFQKTPQITPEGAVLGYADPDGLETVEAWDCVPDCPVAMLDEQSGILSRGHAPRRSKGNPFGPGKGQLQEEIYFDQGGASRFFYCAKTSREERNAGLEAVHTLFEKREGMEDKIQHRTNPGGLENDPRWAPKLSKNHHPTVKPIALMRYLCRLVTPPGGVVLDPFAGSGSTGCAAALEEFQFIGIEKEKEYAEIARARMAHYSGRMP